jgi:hypothetical protein
VDDHADELKAMRDSLIAHADKIESGTAATADLTDLAAEMRARLEEIATKVPTASGAPSADSPGSRAAHALHGSPTAFKHAAEILTVGLYAAQ